MASCPSRESLQGEEDQTSQLHFETLSQVRGSKEANDFELVPTEGPHVKMGLRINTYLEGLL